MKYITHRRFKSKCMSGEVNFPALTEFDCRGGVIFYGSTPICYDTSEDAFQFFARDDDGNGLLRGNLTQLIQKTLRKHDEKHQARWDKVWEDPYCLPYKQEAFEDHWLWNYDFYNAEILTLQHIATIVGAKED